MRLYIIGNGFDIAHNLPTSYKHFKTYMETNHKRDYDRIGGMFSCNRPDQLWMDFENNLSKLNVVGLFKRNILDWKDYDLWDNKKYYGLQNAFDSLFKDINWHFSDWIHDTLQNLKSRGLYDLSSDDLFISFNYTETLEKIYQIPSERICHIHGNCVENPNKRPIFGHGISDTKTKEFVISKHVEMMADAISQCGLRNNLQDIVSAFEDEMIELLESLRKKTDEGFQECEWMLGEIERDRGAITDVYVLGHSLSNVDIPYFKKIHSLLLHQVNWYVDYHPMTEEKKNEKLCRFKEAMGFNAIPYETIRK